MEIYGEFLYQRKENVELFDDVLEIFGLLTAIYLHKVLHFRAMFPFDQGRQLN